MHKEPILWASVFRKKLNKTMVMRSIFGELVRRYYSKFPIDFGKNLERKWADMAAEDVGTWMPKQQQASSSGWMFVA